MSGEGRTRTADTAIFSRVLYQLSYLAAAAEWYRRSRSGASFDDDARPFSLSILNSA